jgi:hypothetical protein
MVANYPKPVAKSETVFSISPLQYQRRPKITWVFRPISNLLDQLACPIKTNALDLQAKNPEGSGPLENRLLADPHSPNFPTTLF